MAAIQVITLDGTASYFDDPCGVTFFTWQQVGGAPVELSDAGAGKPTFTPDSEGRFTFSLVVSDGIHTSQADEMIVLVGNRAPVADAGTNRICQIPERVTLDGRDSFDPDMIDELTYRWTQLEGPPVVLEDAETATPFFDCNEEGTYVFELVVNDGFVDSQPDSVNVTTFVLTVNFQPLNPGHQAEGYFFYADVSGSKVVSSVGWANPYVWDIKCKDVETGEVESYVSSGIDMQPKIDGDLLVWSGGPDSGNVGTPECLSVFARDISSGRQITLREHSDYESYSHPAVSGDKVVWLQHLDIDKNWYPDDWADTAYDISGADVSDINNPVYFTIAQRVGTRDPYPINTWPEDFDDVIDISGNIVVWEAEGDIYGADISDLDRIQVFSICSNSSRQYDPAISGNWVVWTDERNDGGDIYAADVSDLEDIREFVITKAQGYQIQPAIDGCLVVYVDGSPYGGSIRAACITRDLGVANVAIPTLPTGISPAIDSESIVWLTNTYGELRGIRLQVAYSISAGPVANVTSGHHYDYIQHAINAAFDGDEIVVDPGLYAERIRFAGKNVTVRSKDPQDAAVVAATVISDNDRVVSFSGGVDSSCVLAGFTVTGGKRGIYCVGSSPRIANCVIAENKGSGIELRGESMPVISNCFVNHNGGHGIEMWSVQVGRFIYYSRPDIVNSLFAENVLDGIMGGIPTITGCTVACNGGVGISSGMLTVRNSIVYHNAGEQITGVYGTVSYSDVEGSRPGIGNIDIDPVFVELGHWSDDANGLGDSVWVAGDYHPGGGSPCFDSGDPNYEPGVGERDLDGNQRLTGTAVDMGAFELAGGMLEVSEDVFGFEAALGGGNPSDQLLLIRNAGVGELAWEITCDSPWLSLDKTSGIVSGRYEMIWLSVDATGLAAGEHTCDMTIAAGEAGNCPMVCRITLNIEKHCFPDTPEYAKQYADFVGYMSYGADPSCWCAPRDGGRHYQCDGDADGKTQSTFEYRVFTEDLAQLIWNWKKRINDANPCADFDHKSETVFEYRVYTKDLQKLITNWKKLDSALPGDCPRADGQ